MKLIALPTRHDVNFHRESDLTHLPDLNAVDKGSSPMSIRGPEEQRMQELENMLKEAQSHAEIMEREAYDKAYAAGEKAGMALGEKRAEQILASLKELLEQTELELQKLEAQSVDVVTDIAQVILMHILGSHGEQQQAMLQTAINKANIQFSTLTNLTMLVHPDDMQGFERMMDEEKIKQYRLQSDSSVAVGSCRLLSVDQDMLVDPSEAMQRSVASVRSHLKEITAAHEQHESLTII